MKYLICLALIMCASVSKASPSLKISSQLNLFNTARDTRPQVGVLFYAPIMKRVSTNIYSGTGIDPYQKSKDMTWYTTKVQLNYAVKKWTISPGVSYSWNSEDNGRQDFVFVRVDYQIF